MLVMKVLKMLPTYLLTANIFLKNYRETDVIWTIVIFSRDNSNEAFPTECVIEKAHPLSWLGGVMFTTRLLVDYVSFVSTTMAFLIQLKQTISRLVL